MVKKLGTTTMSSITTSVHVQVREIDAITTEEVKATISRVIGGETDKFQLEFLREAPDKTQTANIRVRKPLTNKLLTAMKPPKTTKEWAVKQLQTSQI